MVTVKVLIAAGDTAGADELSTCAASAGFHVMEQVYSVKDAVTFAESLHPDIVLIETVLFGKKKITEVLEKIQIVGNIPVILITDADEDISEIHNDSNRPYGILVRPFGPVLLKEVVEEAIYRHSLEAGENDRGKRMRSGAVVRKVAHDINNSLSSALANIQLARRSCAREDHLCRHLDDAEKGILRARDQSRQLLIPRVSPENESGAARKASVPGLRRQSHAGKNVSAKGIYRILLMDDEEAILSATSEMLSFLGHKVTIAKTGEEAVALFRKAKDNALPFDAVILDITVPGGIGAGETLPLLKKIEPDVRAIISSGYATHPLLISFAANGFSAALIKPYGFKELEESLGHLV
ncbi:response regulator [Methanoregula sp.]|jgi:DNA-binding NtrC family response regulator|uniref:response regulator n=1 Tax=Methanoregula sp. TaxID=2052170 RepID=UPI003C172FAA